MARAKYKLGTMIQIDGDQGAEHGVVDGILTTKSGYFYHLEGKEAGETVEENDITAAFRPVATRKVVAKKTSKKATARKRPSVSVEEEEESQD